MILDASYISILIYSKHKYSVFKLIYSTDQHCIVIIYVVDVANRQKDNSVDRNYFYFILSKICYT